MRLRKSERVWCHCIFIAGRDVEAKCHTTEERGMDGKMVKFTFLAKRGFSFHTFLKTLHYVQLSKTKWQNSELNIP